MHTGSLLVRVSPHPGGGWDIREPGTSRVLEHVAGRSQAVARAQILMVNGGSVQVVDQDGFLQQAYTVPSPGQAAWWYSPPLPMYWVMGVLFVGQGVVGLASSGTGGFGFWFGAVMAVLGTLYLVLVLASRRRNRRLVQTEDQGD